MRPFHEQIRLVGATGGPTKQPVWVRWLGTAGFSLRADDHVVLFDPYLTRASLGRCLRGDLRPDAAVVTRHVARADAVVVGHTHFDHVLDVPLVARTTRATVFGSTSAAVLCRADGVPPSQVVDVEGALRRGRYVTEVGPFRLEFFPSAHSRLLLGRVPAAGEIADCDAVPTTVGGYRCGAVFAVEVTVFGRTFFHLGSAELVEESVPRRSVDTLFFTVAGWTSSREIPERVVRHLSPRQVVLGHWDDFFRPLAEPVHALPALSLPRLRDRFHAAAPAVSVGTLPLLEEVPL